MRRLRYSVPYIAGKKLPKDSDPAPRGAGPFSRTSARCGRHFNPPAPCGAGQEISELTKHSVDFNPPAPCGAGLVDNHYLRTDRRFQSTRPLRGRTRGRRACMPALTFQSTRPLRGGTWRSPRDRGLPRNFNPPAPCGAGPISKTSSICLVYFNPPAPCGAGLRNCSFSSGLMISIHPPLAGRDR